MHGERRKRGLFAPHCGMLFENTARNIKIASNNELPCVDINLDEDGAPYYSLCNSFHIRSKKNTPSRFFRDIKHSSLRINSSVCEQKNADMAKDRLVTGSIFAAV